MGLGVWAWEDRGAIWIAFPHAAKRGPSWRMWILLKSVASSTDWGPVAPGRTGGLTSHGPTSHVTPRPTFFKAS